MNTPTITAAKNIPAVAATIEGSKLTLTFSHGESLVLDASTLTADIAMAATMHGLKQKLVDAAAIARDTATGRSATIADKYAAVKEIFDRITGTEPTWNKVIKSAPSMKGGMFLAAMMELTGKPREAMVAYLEGLSKEQTAALKLNPRVAVIMERMAAERAKPKGPDNSDDLLAALMGVTVEPELREGEDGEADEHVGEENMDEVPPMDVPAAKDSRARRMPKSSN